MSSNSSSILIYDNAAFDSSSHSHLPLQPIALTLKENITPSPSPPPPSSKKPPISIDDEIADIESQIHRLSKKLQSLKIKKAQIQLTAAVRTPASSKRGRIVPAKFMSPQEPRRRGLSLGPQEIYRKPCFPKLEGIKEEKQPKLETPAAARRRGISLGPSEIATNSKAATVGAKKPMKFDRDSMTGIKPKNLFDEKKRSLKSAGAKVRIVPSRYSLAPGGNEEASRRRKWALEEEEEKRKKRSLSLGGGGGNTLRRSSPSSILKVAEGLPKIRTMRRGGESPRDSGCAKRVAELVGKELAFAERLRFEEEEA